jgi:2,5-dichloro-2,5-cyclohexadiene-1,4-diol dehydrogenase 1
MGRALEGKSIIVTGAGSGIGRATSEIMAQRGARVMVADINVDGAKETVARIERAGGKAHFARCDVSQEEEVEKLVAEVASTYGKLDGAFNNAGVPPAFKVLHELSREQFDRCINVNLAGVFLCMKHQIAAMLRTGGGSIVNTASVAGVVGLPVHAEYIASKHGVIGLTKAAAIEYGRHNIRVNAVLPGGVRTPMITTPPNADEAIAQSSVMHPIGRIGEPVEIGEAAAWLLSDAASFVTGASLSVDGGFTAH